MKKYIVIMVCLLVSFGCKQTDVKSDYNDSVIESVTLNPKTGYYAGNDWGRIYLTKTANGYKGTYSGTWEENKGEINLWKEDGKWIGSWEEPLINRGGNLYKIQILNNSNTIKGLYSLIKTGGGNPFKDKPFIWVYQDK